MERDRGIEHISTFSTVQFGKTFGFISTYV